MKIVKLELDENSLLGGIDAVALVENPAIEEDFLMFAKESFQSFDDYPKAARENARVGIERNKALGNKCATQVGKVRAQQLAKGEPVSLDTIRRMRSFLIRQKDNYELAVSRKDYEACGYISYLLWGGPEALPWAEKKLRQAGEEFAEVGPRGGIKGSPKAPKSTTPGEGRRGSKTNKPGAAATSRGVKVPQRIEKSLQKKSDDFNERYKEKLGYGVSVAKLRAVYQRGIGAYETSHSPNVRSAEQWAQARVNAFLYLVKNGRPQNKKYTSDYDLLPKGHPKAEEMAKIVEGFYVEKLVQQYFGIVGEIDGTPVYETKEQAMIRALEMGCSGYHEHILNEKTVYMPCDKHSEATDKVEFARQQLDEKQMLVGPLMIPNQLILRKDEDGEDYYVYFDEETIEKLAYKTMEDKIGDRVNIEHNQSENVKDVYLAESWIILDEENDKSKYYGFDLPVGTWMGIYKVNNKQIWDEYVKEGKVKGFSVEGYFAQKMLDKFCKQGVPCACGLSSTGVCDGSHNNK